MKDFLKYMLATVCGIITLSIVCGIFFMVSFASMIASSSASKKAEKNSVFVLKMDGMVSERTEGGSPLDLVNAIKKAKNNENIKGIYLEGGTTMFDAPATAQQVRDALADFKNSGKWIIAFADRYTQGSYYVCSVADSIFMDRQGMIDFKGMGGKNFYMTGLYEKIGVTYQATRVGKYKSAVESVTRKDMSENDREQRTAYLQGIWNVWLKQMAESRGVTPEHLNQLADDSIMAFANIEDYKTAKLIDDVIFPEKIKEIVKNKLGIDEDDDINQLTLADMMDLKDDEKEDGDKIAVYYAYGEIIDQEVSAFAGEHAIVGDKTVEDLNELAKDDDVKAVVLRVNSPGGSAIASEHIWHAIKQLKEKKPVVVSMGGYAASGGYMISAPANYIFAEPTTITGSIGIFGLVPNMNELVTNKLGITWDGVSTNKYSDYENRLMFDKNNADVIRFMQTYVDRGYDSFLTIVADGRGMTKEQVNEIAQGRVWVASDAVGIKLVDKLGSLEDAVKKAAELAKLEEYYTAPYPGKTDWLEALLNSEEKKGSYLDAEMKKTLGELYEPVMEMRRDQQRNRLQARLPFATGI